MSQIDIAEVKAWAEEGGAIARRYFNNVTRTHKADRTLVTQADIEIEQVLRTHIEARYPDHGIMGEEQGIGAIDREFVWSLDPLDGTASFVSGLPIWGVSIGLLRDGLPYLGVVYLPMLDDCYWVDASGPAYRNDVPIQVSAVAEFDGNDWMAVSSNAHRRFRISFPGKTRSLGSVAAEFCYVARGSAVGALISRANLWDMAAGLALLRAAGGVATLFSAAPLDIPPLLDGRKISEPLLISTPALLEPLRGYIKRAE